MRACPSLVVAVTGKPASCCIRCDRAVPALADKDAQPIVPEAYRPDPQRSEWVCAHRVESASAIHPTRRHPPFVGDGYEVLTRTR